MPRGVDMNPYKMMLGDIAKYHAAVDVVREAPVVAFSEKDGCPLVQEEGRTWKRRLAPQYIISFLRGDDQEFVITDD